MKGVYIQWAEVSTRQLLLQPVAAGAVEEVTNPSKHLGGNGSQGGSASIQAETQVNAEQASKHGDAGAEPLVPGRRPPPKGGKSAREEQRFPFGPAGVVASAWLQTEIDRNTGGPGRCGV